MVANRYPRRQPPQPRQTRQEMIDETSRFLSWALGEDVNLPRIPRRKVSDGGFTAMLAQPGAKAMVQHYWDRALGRVLNRWWT